MLQVQYISPQTFYGTTDNSDGTEADLTHYQYPPPASHSVDTNVSGEPISHISPKVICQCVCVCVCVCVCCLATTISFNGQKDIEFGRVKTPF